MQHAYVLEHPAEQHLDTTACARHPAWMSDAPLGERPPWGVPVTRRERLRFRLSLIALAWPTLFSLWTVGARYPLRHDPHQVNGGYRLKDHRAATRRGLLPSWTSPHTAMPGCLRRSYDPTQEGSLSTAVEYPAVSPAAGATAGPAGRTAAFRRPRDHDEHGGTSE